MRFVRWGILALALLATVFAPAATHAEGRGPRLIRVGRYVSGAWTGTEIVSVQSSSGRAIVTNAEGNYVDVLDLAEPARPRRLARHTLPVRAGESLTCAAFHPEDSYYLATLASDRPHVLGRLLIVNARSGMVLAEHPVGVGPDSVVVDAAGKTALVANEAEGYWFDRRTGAFRSRRGGISIVDLSRGPRAAAVRSFSLRDQTGAPGFAHASHRRVLERAVDYNGNGRIDGAEGATRIPLRRNTPETLEPECVAFSPDGQRAYATLQENNGLLVFDPRVPRVLAIVGLGTTTHAADLRDDGETRFEDELTALREPDGLVVTPDGRYVVTADEGDTGPNARPGRTGGGGRTVSLFDAETGAFVADTGNQLDAAAHAAGVYPDGRSDKRGSEPESVLAFEVEGVTYVVAALEWANALALLSLQDPTAPRVLRVVPLEAGSRAPEGLALHRDRGRVFVYSANEMSGDVTIFEFRDR